MASEGPPAPPGQTGPQPDRPAGVPIVDMRDVFERKTPQTKEDRAQTRAFISGKIEMIRGDPHMSPEEKATAIAELEKLLAEN